MALASLSPRGAPLVVPETGQAQGLPLPEFFQAANGFVECGV